MADDRSSPSVRRCSARQRKPGLAVGVHPADGVDHVLVTGALEHARARRTPVAARADDGPGLRRVQLAEPRGQAGRAGCSSHPRGGTRPTPADGGCRSACALAASACCAGTCAIDFTGRPADRQLSNPPSSSADDVLVAHAGEPHHRLLGARGFGDDQRSPGPAGSACRPTRRTDRRGSRAARWRDARRRRPRSAACRGSPRRGAPPPRTPRASIEGGSDRVTREPRAHAIGVARVEEVDRRLGDVAGDVGDERPRGSSGASAGFIRRSRPMVLQDLARDAAAAQGAGAVRGIDAGVVGQAQQLVVEAVVHHARRGR